MSIALQPDLNLHKLQLPCGQKKGIKRLEMTFCASKSPKHHTNSVKRKRAQFLGKVSILEGGGADLAQHFLAKGKARQFERVHLCLSYAQLHLKCLHGIIHIADHHGGARHWNWRFKKCRDAELSLEQSREFNQPALTK